MEMLHGKELLRLAFLERKEDVIFMGPAGVGKTFLASASEQIDASCSRAPMTCDLRQSRANNSTERVLRGYISVDLLIIDDLGLRKLSGDASILYEVLIARHKRAPIIVTSNRVVDQWIALFEDPILAQSCLDRLARNALQVIIEGDIDQKRQRPAARSKKNVARSKKAKEPRTGNRGASRGGVRMLKNQSHAPEKSHLAAEIGFSHRIF